MSTNATPYKQELRTRILDTAMALFKSQGVKKVKMDDIATTLGISKRTLYEIYSNKEELLFEGIKRGERQKQRLMNEFSLTAPNEMEIVVEALKLKLRELGQVNPLFFSELHKYGRIVDYLQQQHEEMRQQTLAFFRRAVVGGYFRRGINYDIFMQMGDSFMNHVMETKMYERYSLKDIFMNYVNVQIRGLCTPKGLRILSAKLPESV